MRVLRTRKADGTWPSSSLLIEGDLTTRRKGAQRALFALCYGGFGAILVWTDGAVIAGLSRCAHARERRTRPGGPEATMKVERVSLDDCRSGAAPCNLMKARTGPELVSRLTI